MTPSLVRCILTAQSLCCSLYSHRFARRDKLPASELVGGQTSYTDIETQRLCSVEISFGGKSVKCLCTNPPTSVTAVFGGKLRRRHEWLCSSDTVESPLISLQFMSSSVQTILRSGLGRRKVRLFCSADTESCRRTNCILHYNGKTLSYVLRLISRRNIVRVMLVFPIWQLNSMSWQYTPPPHLRQPILSAATSAGGKPRH